jgi:hypothetical protein
VTRFPITFNIVREKVMRKLSSEELIQVSGAGDYVCPPPPCYPKPPCPPEQDAYGNPGNKKEVGNAINVLDPDKFVENTDPTGIGTRGASN